MTTREIALLLEARGFRFVKSLGQNFLMDEDVLEDIAALSNARGKNVLEIGAGGGCLSKALAPLAEKLLCVEIDKNLLPVLETVLHPYKNVTLLQADALRLDLAAVTEQTFGGEPFVVCANLPYGITAELMQRFFELPKAAELTLLLQREAAQKLLCGPGGKDYGPAPVLRQYLYEGELALSVPPHCFLPQPHVDSAVLHLVRRSADETQEYPALKRFVKRCFAMRRKTLANNLADVPREVLLPALEALSLPAAVRAEQLELRQFLALMRTIG